MCHSEEPKTLHFRRLITVDLHLYTVVSLFHQAPRKFELRHGVLLLWINCLFSVLITRQLGKSWRNLVKQFTTNELSINIKLDFDTEFLLQDWYHEMEDMGAIRKNILLQWQKFVNN